MNAAAYVNVTKDSEGNTEFQFAAMHTAGEQHMLWDASASVVAVCKDACYIWGNSVTAKPPIINVIS